MGALLLQATPVPLRGPLQSSTREKELLPTGSIVLESNTCRYHTSSTMCGTTALVCIHEYM
jgi:hypothetical protein